MSKYYHLNYLQLFADEGADGGNGQDGADDNDKGDNGADKKKKSADTDTKNTPKYSDADLDEILNRKVAEIASKYEKKADEAKKLAQMNAQEKAEYENKQLKEELDELKRQNAVSKLTDEARKMLTEAQIKNVPDDLLSVLVCSDAEATKKAVDSFAAMFKEAVQAAVVEKLKGGTPKTGGSSGSVTREQIMKVKNKAERQALIRDNMDLFQK